MPRRIRQIHYELPDPDLRDILMLDDAQYYGLGRLVTADSLEEVAKAVPNGNTGFSRLEEPRLTYVSPNVATTRLRDDSAQGGRTIEDRLLGHPGVDVASALIEIPFHVLGFKFRTDSRRSRRSEVSTHLVLEDKKTHFYPSRYQLLGELTLANDFAGTRHAQAEKLEAKASSQFIPKFSINLGIFIADGFPFVNTGEIIPSDALPQTITLAPIQAIT